VHYLDSVKSALIAVLLSFSDQIAKKNEVEKVVSPGSPASILCALIERYLLCDVYCINSELSLKCEADIYLPSKSTLIPYQLTLSVNGVPSEPVKHFPVVCNVHSTWQLLLLLRQCCGSVSYRQKNDVV
jgi:hypothetical protein